MAGDRTGQTVAVRIDSVHTQWAAGDPTRYDGRVRTIWKGAITFGLISIPVRLYPAVQTKTPRFHLLHADDGGRIRYQRVCSVCGKEVDWDDIVKGFEFEKGRYVQLTDEDFESLDVESIRAIDVVTFVPLEQIDPVYFDKPYYVAPEPTGIKAYRLLAEALQAEGQVGVAKVSLRDRESLATVRLRDDVFVLETMHWPDEIRSPEFEELDRKVELRDNEIKMARQLIQQLSGDFEPDAFTDEYRAALEELIQRKIEGEEITTVAEPEQEPTKVVDLMEALKASVDEAKRQRDAGSGGRKKSTRRKASAS